MKSENPVSVGDAIDGAPFGTMQKMIVLLCALVALLDGFDTQAIAFVAPALSSAWNLQPSSFGAVFGAGLAGLMLGALIFGPIADRVGRKSVILVTTLLFGLLTLATASATSLNEVLVLRFLTGLGLGGAMPNIIALTAEYAPARLRATMVSVMFCGFPLGAVLGGFASARMIPVFGWPSVFLVGGIIPILLLPVLAFALPESLRFLSTKKNMKRRADDILRRVLGPDLAARTSLDSGSVEVLERASIAGLFVDGRALRTVLLWTVFFMNLLMLYFLVNWLPMLLKQAGFPLDKAIISTALLNLGGIAGALVFARFVDKWGAQLVLVGAYLLASLATFSIGQITGVSFGVLMVMVFVTGFCVIGAQISINALAAETYPTVIRSTGVGWALGVGRVGSVIGPVAGGFLVAAGLSMSALFGIAAVPGLVACTAVYLVTCRSEDSLARG
ncbi:MAG TPA: MFS transporter [Noviherbaspirillum sp.]|nr:MFS transporter [Noviherbaspirillum sp.]